MCCYKTLHKNEEGYVVFCKSCESLHVGFGNVVLSKSIEEFYSFEARIDAYYREHQCDPWQDLKTISISTAVKSITMVYSPNDLKKLSSILNKAKEKLTLEKLFVFNDN
ncbi:MAG: DUF6686 family protein [Chitinophagaceae bacterium]|jgi:hypothetical protein